MIPTPRRIRTQSDYYSVPLPKPGQNCEFHSKAELIQALLFEANPAIRLYRPQPLKLRADGGIKTIDVVPDFLVIPHKGPSELVQVAPTHRIEVIREKGSVRDSILKRYCKKHGMKLRYIANEDLAVHQRKALNWLPVVQRITLGRNYETQHIEDRLPPLLSAIGATTVGALINHFSTELPERVCLAICRGLHAGRFRADLGSYRFDYNLRIGRNDHLARTA